MANQPKTSGDKNTLGRAELLEWLRRQLADTQMSLLAREQAAEMWRTASDADLRGLGIPLLPAAERLQIAERETQIAASCRRDIAAIHTLHAIVKDH